MHPRGREQSPQIHLPWESISREFEWKKDRLKTTQMLCVAANMGDKTSLNTTFPACMSLQFNLTLEPPAFYKLYGTCCNLACQLAHCQCWEDFIACLQALTWLARHRRPPSRLSQRMKCFLCVLSFVGLFKPACLVKTWSVSTCALHCKRKTKRC